jgi:hypothetical protein
VTSLATQFKKGNEFWKLAPPPPLNPPRIFADARVLWDNAVAFFEWCEATPRERVELVKYQGSASEHTVPLKRPYTKKRFCEFCGVSQRYFDTAQKELEAKRERGQATDSETAVLETIRRIYDIIENEQIEGALVGTYSANLTARLNGLADNTNVTSNQPILRVSVDNEETAALLQELEDLL